MIQRFGKSLAIGLFAIILSTIGIFASDALQGVDIGSNFASVSSGGVCKSGSTPLRGENGVLCVDLFEASASKDCPFHELSNVVESDQNVKSNTCYAASVKGATPWNYINLAQAQQMCARSGKRLPTTAEWYRIALGTNPSECLLSGSTFSVTGNESCVSGSGVFDVVGNVWEWVDENIINNQYKERILPQEGYVTSVDADGIPITSDGAPDPLYDYDYFWSKNEGSFGMIRGGFYGSGKDGGLYTVNASVPTSLTTKGVGFRCVEDVF